MLSKLAFPKTIRTSARCFSQAPRPKLPQTIPKHEHFNIANHIPVGSQVKLNDVVAAKGEGAWLWDTNERKYLDFTSGIGVTSCGHCHPHIVRAVQNQAAEMMHAQLTTCFAHKAQIEMVEQLLKVIPFHDCFHPVSAGTEACENTIKIARQATGKANIIAFDGGFHGRSLGMMSLTSSKVSYRMGFQPLLPAVFFCPDFTQQSFEKLMTNYSHPDETCAVIVEPIQGEGGVNTVPMEFLRYLRKYCTEHDIMLISDEVQCGVGRAGSWWACQPQGEEGIVPDMMAIAKGIASGFPFGLVSARKEVVQRVTSNGIGGTYNGTPMGCAAVTATLEVFEQENVIQNSRDKGAYLYTEIQKLRASIGKDAIQEIRPTPGLFIGVDLNPEVLDVNKVIRHAAENHGLLMHRCGTNAVRVIPALTVNQEECDIFLTRFEKTLQDLL